VTYTKRTMRRLPPNSRKIAQRLNEIEGALRALKRLLPALVEQEQHAITIDRELKRTYEGAVKSNGALFDPEAEALAKTARERLPQ
jgi:hypothetical protein